MNEKLIIPGSIIIAGLIVGAAIYFGGNQSAPAANNQDNQQPDTVEVTKVDPASDHIYGSPNADLFVIEYSDLECPFCKRYHDEVLSRLKETYAENDRVAFVFRHFPLDEPYTQPLHPTATEEAIAAECVGKLGGTDAFYSFVDDIFATTASDGQYDLSQLSVHAEAAGVDVDAFNTCYNNKETESIVSEDFQEGAESGVQGTPTIYLQTNSGKSYSGVPDYNALKVAIDAYLADLK